MKLKQLPEDFVVREVMKLDLKPKGDHGYFVMKKRNWATEKAIRELAKSLKLNPKSFAVSGMKDKNAVTEQYVSCYGLKKEALANVKIKDIKLYFKGYSNKPIGLNSHEENVFDITVRDLSSGLNKIEYFCNYYDDQRFGGIRPVTAVVGRLLVERKFEEAMKVYLTRPFDEETDEHKAFRKEMEFNWGKFNPKKVPGYLTERLVVDHLSKRPDDFLGAFARLPKQIVTLFIHSYQSKLFNQILDKYVREFCEEWFEVEYCYGKLAMTNEPLGIDLPLVGYDFEFADDKVKGIVKEVLKKVKVESFQFKELPFLSSRTVMRPASVQLKTLKMSETEDDELNDGKVKQLISFSLPSGSFATMAVKAMQNRD
ncbi:MAG: tRNA pseudouridine(13) synthase TruD [Candidatus Woesearchaeota archaeon]